MPCYDGSVFTFYGLEWKHEPRTPRLTFGKKCEVDAFVHASGQTIELLGPNFKGSLEILIDTTGDDWELFHLYNDGDLDSEPTVIMASDIADGNPPVGEAYD